MFLPFWADFSATLTQNVQYTRSGCRHGKRDARSEPGMTVKGVEHDGDVDVSQGTHLRGLVHPRTSVVGGARRGQG